MPRKPIIIGLHLMSHTIVLKGFPDPPLFKNLCFPSPLFYSTLFLGISDSSPHPHATLSCPNPTHQPFLHIINGFKQISKGLLYQFNRRYQKSIFNFLNSFTNISGYLNLCGIFSFIFRRFRMTFFHKVMLAEKLASFFFKSITQYCKE